MENTKNEYTVLQSEIEKFLEQITEIEGYISDTWSQDMNLDRLIGNLLNESNLIILSARPGVGKTALALSIANKLTSDYNKKVGYFSLEMESEQLAMRIIAQENRINFAKLYHKKLTKEDLNFISCRYQNSSKTNLIIDATPSISVETLRERCQTMKDKKGIDFFIIDYLELIYLKENVLRELKDITRALGITILATSQLGRSADTKKGDKRPTLSDLRKRNEVEENADSILLLYRPSYYGIIADDIDYSAEPVEVIVAKHPDDGLETVGLRFDGRGSRLY